MSGGRFDYAQYRINDIIQEVEDVIHHNNDQTLDKYGCMKGENLSEDTIKEFRKGLELLRKAQIYAQRMDWLLSGDDGEDSFHERLKEDLQKGGRR
jgi:hypothetical protein